MRRDTAGRGITARAIRCSQPRPRTTTPAMVAREMGNMLRSHNKVSAIGTTQPRITVGKSGGNDTRAVYSVNSPPEVLSPVTGDEILPNRATSILVQAPSTIRDK